MPAPIPILPYSNDRRVKPRPISNAILFFTFYMMGLFVSHFIAAPVVHRAVFQEGSPAPIAMRFYTIGQLLFTAGLILLYITHIRRLRNAYLLAPFAGLLSLVPGLLMCFIT